MPSLLRKQRDREREPLLPRHNQDTTLQTRLDDKLHTYQILKAFSHGYMPSNEQLVAHLRHTAGILRTVPSDISPTGKELIRNLREHLEQLIAFFEDKNSTDQIQDFLWCIAKARLSIDTEDLEARAQEIRPRADIATACMSLSNLGSLLLNNFEFRLFLDDLTTIARGVFRDTAVSLSAASKQVGQEVAPSEGDGDTVKPPHLNTQPPPSSGDIGEDAVEVTNAVVDGAVKVAKDASTSISDNASQDERGTLLARLKQAILNLRQRPDYNESVSTLSLILRRCVKARTRTLTEAAYCLEEHVNSNQETDIALFNSWKLFSSIGNRERWREVEDAFNAVMEHAQDDPEFGRHVDRIGDLVQAMLTDPGFYDGTEVRFSELQDKFPQSISSGFWSDIDTFTNKLRLACSSVWEDHDIKSIADSAKSVVRVLEKGSSHELTSDCINIFVPIVIQAIQYIPIPRLELASPAVDLLLENLILEPGITQNCTSFFPRRAKFTTQNDVEILKGRVNTTSRLRTLFRLSLSGISVSTSDVGYWLRFHSGFLRFGGEGMVSVELDRRGIDIDLDLELGSNCIDEILSVRNVHVKIHRFNYKLRKSNISWIAWVFKPLLRPVIRMMMEAQVKAVIKDFCASVNRELLFARERLRAARVADPNDMWAFIRAVSARPGSKQDADSYLRVGIDEPGMGLFEGVYAPGSVVRLWNEEEGMAAERVRQSSQDGWRNAIFDI